jgi:hypothetical protein
MVIKPDVKRDYLSLAEILIIAFLACIPLFTSFPYRVNIFLSWEGAYRMSQGELPFRDFGIPLGGMYWVIPALFFKLFGAQMITLVKAQVFINILSGLAFRSILKSCGVQPGIRFVAVLLYCLSFSFFNFWPWYNHTVIVYEFIGLAFLMKAITTGNSRLSIIRLVLAAFFTVCSFLTKQDAGAMAVLLCLAILSYSFISTKNWRPLVIYTGALLIILSLFILPFLKYGFGYWFNHGQPPHSSRISLFEITDEFFSNSAWIKFYLFLIVVLLMIRFRKWKQLWEHKNTMLLLVLTLGILVQAAIFQVTSYTPPDNNIFFHSFAIAFILHLLTGLITTAWNVKPMIIVCSAGILLWWSSAYWKYILRIKERTFPSTENSVVSPENVVNRKTFMIRPPDTTQAAMSEANWVFSGLSSFHKIYMPGPTVAGISRLLNMDIIKSKKELRVLNMSELTPLAREIPYRLERGSRYPLWYHLGVGMFNKQAELFEKNISAKEYDLVLFEYIPALNNFYPFRVRDSLMIHYNKTDSFPAPRRGETSGMIEVYIRR